MSFPFWYLLFHSLFLSSLNAFSHDSSGIVVIFVFTFDTGSSLMAGVNEVESRDVQKIFSATFAHSIHSIQRENIIEGGSEGGTGEEGLLNSLLHASIQTSLSNNSNRFPHTIPRPVRLIFVQSIQFVICCRFLAKMQDPPQGRNQSPPKDESIHKKNTQKTPPESHLSPPPHDF